MRPDIDVVSGRDERVRMREVDFPVQEEGILVDEVLGRLVIDSDQMRCSLRETASWVGGYHTLCMNPRVFRPADCVRRP